MKKKDIILYTTMINSFAEHGLNKEAVQLFEEMKLKGIKPNEQTFTCLLNACSHSELVKEGLHYYEFMKNIN